MGGIQGCRVFKIKGVRDLIEQFSPMQDFTLGDAMRLISPGFQAYEQLYIGNRQGERLTPSDAFSYLLDRKILRVGLKFKCPSCQLPFWRALDDAQTLLICDNCGNEFNAAPQLKDRSWAYRPSGLFGRGDKQEGGVPVALTLQQLETTLATHPITWLPAMNLSPLSVQIEKCETDFVLVSQDWRGRVKLVIGECKTNKNIEASDVQNLSKVADSFPADRFDVFLVFSKTGNFSDEEIDLCRAADSSNRRRTILLSARELEPYSIYEQAAKEFAINATAVSLEDMVEATGGIFFDPRGSGQRD
jgi:hypothetical protein